MPYRNIVWVKLEKRLLHDHRFYLMSMEAQLIYLKLLMLAAETNNKIPKDPQILANIFRVPNDPTIIEKSLKEIQEKFPKFKNWGKIYKFSEFMDKHNRVVPRETPGKPEDNADKIRKERDKKRIDIYMQHFKKRHKETTGVPYIPSYAKDRRLMMELLDFKDEEVVTLINEFFNATNEWWSDKLSIGVFKVSIPKIIGRLRK